MFLLNFSISFFFLLKISYSNLKSAWNVWNSWNIVVLKKSLSKIHVNKVHWKKPCEARRIDFGDTNGAICYFLVSFLRLKMPKHSFNSIAQLSFLFDILFTSLQLWITIQFVEMQFFLLNWKSFGIDRFTHKLPMDFPNEWNWNIFYCINFSDVRSLFCLYILRELESLIFIKYIFVISETNTNLLNRNEDGIFKDRKNKSEILCSIEAKYHLHKQL